MSTNKSGLEFEDKTDNLINDFKTIEIDDKPYLSYKDFPDHTELSRISFVRKKLYDKKIRF